MCKLQQPSVATRLATDSVAAHGEAHGALRDDLWLPAWSVESIIRVEIEIGVGKRGMLQGLQRCPIPVVN